MASGHHLAHVGGIVSDLLGYAEQLRHSNGESQIGGRDEVDESVAERRRSLGRTCALCPCWKARRPSAWPRPPNAACLRHPAVAVHLRVRNGVSPGSSPSRRRVPPSQGYHAVKDCRRRQQELQTDATMGLKIACIALASISAG